MSPEPIDLEAIERRLIGYVSSDAGQVVQDCWHLASEVRRLRAEVAALIDVRACWAADYEALSKARAAEADGLREALASAVYGMAKERDEARAERDAAKARGLDTIALYARERNDARRHLLALTADRDALAKRVDTLSKALTWIEHHVSSAHYTPDVAEPGHAISGIALVARALSEVRS